MRCINACSLIACGGWSHLLLPGDGHDISTCCAAQYCCGMFYSLTFVFSSFSEFIQLTFLLATFFGTLFIQWNELPGHLNGTEVRYVARECRMDERKNALFRAQTDPNLVADNMVSAGVGLHRNMSHRDPDEWAPCTPSLFLPLAPLRPSASSIARGHGIRHRRADHRPWAPSMSSAL
jgi:hypothetical protein